MGRDQVLTERLRLLLAELTSVTVSGTLCWERQLYSAHRYARWNDNMLILGPTASLDDPEIPRYLFLTPLNSPTASEITTEDAELRAALLALVCRIRGRNSRPKAERP